MYYCITLFYCKVYFENYKTCDDRIHNSKLKINSLYYMKTIVVKVLQKQFRHLWS